eukprot:TRINITY_DN30760_c0_g1_i1.p1 TRINITY_DN30760_c0_g1~~TRINITY_DN30760_c0_g1_i1.p1  ORF type:complete len:607 (+),score=182.72 TRINITY_DN30760_c0_g1_i1:96-1916(+)
MPNFPPNGVLEIGHGKVRGDWLPLQKQSQFKGVPYATPPLGAHRFRKSKPIDKPWEGVVDCTSKQVRRIALQAPQPEKYDEATTECTEDCLYLNLWMPDSALDFTRRPHSVPVVVLVHGGGLLSGSCHDAEVDGAEYAKRGVIAVAPNYRLGPLGVLRLGPNGDYNCCLWDIMAALEFVNRQIHFFGGDANNVTLCGIGSGGDLAMALLASSHAYALRYFQKVVLQNCTLPIPVTMQQADELAIEFKAAIGVECDKAVDWFSLDSSTIIAAQTTGWYTLTHTVPGRRCADLFTPLFHAARKYATTAGGLGILTNARRGVNFVYPVRDGDLIKDSPLVGLANGVGRGVPVLLGCDTNCRPHAAAATFDEMVKLLAWELTVAPGRLDKGANGLGFANQRGSTASLAESPRGVAFVLEDDPDGEDAAEKAKAAAKRILEFYETRAREELKRYGHALAQEFVWEWVCSDLLHQVPLRLISDNLALQQTSDKPATIHAYQFLSNVDTDRTGHLHPSHVALSHGDGAAVPNSLSPLRAAWLDVWTSFFAAANPELPLATYTPAAKQVTQCSWDAAGRAPRFCSGFAVRAEEVEFLVATLKGLWGGVYLHEPH